MSYTKEITLIFFFFFFFVMYLSPLKSQVYLLVTLFSKLYVTFILQWIVFIFGRDEEEDQ